MSPTTRGAELVDAAARFANDHIDPRAAEWERTRGYPRDSFAAAAGEGLCGLLVASDLGGAGLTPPEFAAVMSRLAAADMGFAFSLVCHNNLAGAIARRGTDEQRGRYLDPMMSGEALGSFLLTEPGVGSDAAAISTTATPDGEGWRLSGAKAWVTNGTDTDVLSVYAQTDPGAGARGIATFLVEPDQDGVVREPAYEMLAAHATGTASFRFENVRLDPGQLFVAPGEGFGAAMEGIDIARIVVSAMVSGMLRRGLDIAVDYVADREAFGAPLSSQQGLRWMLADVATDLEAAEALAGRASEALAEGSPEVGVRAAHAKKFATRVAMDGLSTCMQALGANGFRHDRPLARHLAAAKMAQYLDGTTEIQNVVIARSMFGR